MKSLHTFIALYLCCISLTLHAMRPKISKTVSYLIQKRFNSGSREYYQTSIEFGEIIDGKRVKTHDIKVISEQDFQTTFEEVHPFLHAQLLKFEIEKSLQLSDNHPEKASLSTLIDDNLENINTHLTKNNYDAIKNLFTQFFTKKIENLESANKSIQTITKVNAIMLKQLGKDYESSQSYKEDLPYVQTKIDNENKITDLKAHQTEIMNIMQTHLDRYNKQVAHEEEQQRLYDLKCARIQRIEDAKLPNRIRKFVESTTVYKYIKQLKSKFFDYTTSNFFHEHQKLTPLERLQKNR